jgi:hypothetical protein
MMETVENRWQLVYARHKSRTATCLKGVVVLRWFVVMGTSVLDSDNLDCENDQLYNYKTQILQPCKNRTPLGVCVAMMIVRI